MRVAIVTTYPPGQGSLNEYGYHFVRSLRRKDEVTEVIVLADELPAGQSYESEARTGASRGAAGGTSGDGAPLRIVPCWRFNSLTNAPRIAAAVAREKPDVVLFNLQFASFGRTKLPASVGLAAPALTRAQGVPTVVLLHNIMETIDLKGGGYAANPWVEKVIRAAGVAATRLLLRAHLVALTIPKYVEILQERYHATNVLLAPHGSFEDAPADTTLPAFDPPEGPLQILAFGKFGTYKRVETLVEAYRCLLERAPAGQELELVIAGTDNPNTPGYLDGIRSQYADVPNIRFTGYVAEEAVPKLFSDSAVVVFPYTTTTGSSGVLHQAGSYGRAAVLPEIGDFAEVIADEGYTGEFFEPGNVLSLADAMARVLNDPERRRDIGARNFLAARGLPIADVVDWYVLHFQELRRRLGKT
jgi:glycosyltransferase involved in cell wall biosynthesis